MENDYKFLEALWCTYHIRYHCLKDHKYLLIHNKQYRKLFGYEFKDKKACNDEIYKVAKILNLLCKLMKKKK